jgi:3-hydroxyacyl-CoA dehydrogenase/enoyl-CoA hydratase/3-hydroxybutyryl-CoA epimerase
MPWSGGPFSWLDMLGAAQAASACDALAAAHGDRFAAPALLREMAGRGESFYARFAPAERAA